MTRNTNCNVINSKILHVLVTVPLALSIYQVVLRDLHPWTDNLRSDYVILKFTCLIGM